MSKQPCVWVVEARGHATKLWCVWDTRSTRQAAELSAERLAVNVKGADFRVAKYVRVEPAKKKGSKP